MRTEGQVPFQGKYGSGAELSGIAGAGDRLARAKPKSAEWPR